MKMIQVHRIALCFFFAISTPTAIAQAPGETGEPPKSESSRFARFRNLFTGDGDKQPHENLDKTEKTDSPPGNSAAEANRRNDGEAEPNSSVAGDEAQTDSASSEPANSDDKNTGYFGRIRRYSETLKNLDSDAAAKLRELMNSGELSKVPQRSEIMKVIAEFREEAVNFLVANRDRLTDAVWIAAFLEAPRAFMDANSKKPPKPSWLDSWIGSWLGSIVIALLLIVVLVIAYEPEAFIKMFQVIIHSISFMLRLVIKAILSSS